MTLFDLLFLLYATPVGGTELGLVPGERRRDMRARFYGDLFSCGYRNTIVPLKIRINGNAVKGTESLSSAWKGQHA